MTTVRSCGLLASILIGLHLSTCMVGSQAPENRPVLTRVSEPRLHGEGPYWDPTDNVLYYVDIAGKTLVRFDPATRQEKTLKFDKPVTMVVPLKDQKYKFVVTLGLDMVVLTWDWDSGFYTTSPIVSVDQDHPKNRWNDGKADAKGRMWAGTMGNEEPIGVVEMNVARFYRVDNDPAVACRADVQVEPVSISNGLAWTADNKILYYTDTPTRRIDAFDFDLEKGTISNRRPVFEFGSVAGNPDGITLDSDGNLWIGCWGGYQVIQVNPTTGKVMRQIKLPVERVTTPLFGGENLDILYVTSMRVGLNSTELKKQPHAGALWAVTNLGVTGTLSMPAVVNCKCNQ